MLIEVQKQFRDAAYMRRHHGSNPVDLVFHGDTGCYTMLMFEPNQDLMHNYSGMGLGGATGAGIDPFITNKQVVFMGDSTFFHSGVTAISNSLKNGQDITYIILDNQTTGMTGHQTTPGQSRGLMGEDLPAKHDRIVEGMLSGHEGRAEVVRANPAYRSQWKNLLEETILEPGVKVVIADKECGITFHRRAELLLGSGRRGAESGAVSRMGRFRRWRVFSCLPPCGSMVGGDVDPASGAQGGRRAHSRSSPWEGEMGIHCSICFRRFHWRIDLVGTLAASPGDGGPSRKGRQV